METSQNLKAQKVANDTMNLLIKIKSEKISKYKIEAQKILVKIASASK
jgi:hypothetical protein